MKTFKTSLIALAIAAPGVFLYQGCELEKGCTVNSQCGQDYLCRDNECIPRCTTYLTCAEGEACVYGACQIPPADYCDYIAPANAPDSGVYLPCPVEGGVDVQTGGASMGGASTGGSDSGAGTNAPMGGASADVGALSGGSGRVLNPTGGGSPASDAGTDTLP